MSLFKEFLSPLVLVDIYIVSTPRGQYFSFSIYSKYPGGTILLFFREYCTPRGYYFGTRGTILFDKRIAEIDTIQKRTHASSMLKVGFSGLQGKLVDIMFILRHKDIANKQVTGMGYYFRGRGKKAYFHPIMRQYTTLFPISRSFSGNYGQFCPVIFKASNMKIHNACIPER